MTVKWQRDDFTITDDFSALDITLIHDFLRHSYWAKEIPRETVVRSLEHSICFGMFYKDKQIGFCRVVTDCATFAYLADVFVMETFRAQGLGKWLVDCVLAHPDLQGLRRWMLSTLDAHWLYEKNNFVPLKHPDWFMEIAKPNIYLNDKND